MRKLFVWAFLCVFGWQLVGYTIYFEWKHFRIKKEIKSLLKRGVPAEELVDFHFNATEIRQLNWLKENEFEWNNQLFDVVQSFTGCDGITHFRCISDTQEKSLFKDLNKHVASNLNGDDQNATVLKVIKVVFLNTIEFPEITAEFQTVETKKEHCFTQMNLISRVIQPLTPPPNLSCLSYRC